MLGKHPTQSQRSPTETTLKHSIDVHVTCTMEMKMLSTLSVGVVKRYPRGPDVFISVFLAWSPRATANQLTGMLVVRCLLSKIASNAFRNIIIIYTSSASRIHSFNSFFFFLSLTFGQNSNFPKLSKMNLIPLFVALSALLYGTYVFLESNLEKFYVFEPTQLHDFAKSAIAEHGNDTRAIVTDIVANLQTTAAKPYVNLDQEWVFNNAGGAMGAMYIIHASKSKIVMHQIKQRTRFLTILKASLSTLSSSARPLAPKATPAVTLPTTTSIS